MLHVHASNGAYVMVERGKKTASSAVLRGCEQLEERKGTLLDTLNDWKCHSCKVS
eukprot:m.109378 g.109378  ORF g.109378 m.109378 type:complete len:55 (+) comp15341_c0_seq31:3165-3329(+)